MYALDSRLTRASRRELHQKSAAAAKARRQALAVARAALAAGKAVGHTHTGSHGFKLVRRDGQYRYKYAPGSFELGPWYEAYESLQKVWLAQYGLSKCHRLWGLLDAPQSMQRAR